MTAPSGVPPETEPSVQQLLSGRWVPAVPLKASWELHWWTRLIHRWIAPRRYPICACGVCQERRNPKHLREWTPG
jgi:hypothetical protein